MQNTSTILMVRPAAFGYNEETAANNFFQTKPEKETAKTIHQKAVFEFDEMVKQLRNYDIEVVVIDDSVLPLKPDAIFPNNWFCTLPTGELCVFPMFAKSRREEKRGDIIKKIAAEYNVLAFQDWSEFEAEGRYIEGTGSMIIDHTNKFIYACLSERTDESVLEKFASRNSFNAIAFTATDYNGNKIYHTNVMMCLGEQFCILCDEAIEDENEKIALMQLLRISGKKIISISRAQVNAFAGNMLELINKNGQHFLIMSQTAFNSLNPQQINKIEKFCTIIAIAVPTIEKVEGGSVRCMMAEIFLEKK